MAPSPAADEGWHLFVLPTVYTAQYLKEVSEIAGLLDLREIDQMVELLSELRRRGGRLFALGVGGHRRPRLARRQRPVETTTLDRFFEEEGWPPVRLVKVVIEGAEPAAWREFRPF